MTLMSFAGSNTLNLSGSNELLSRAEARVSREKPQRTAEPEPASDTGEYKEENVILNKAVKS